MDFRFKTQNEFSRSLFFQRDVFLFRAIEKNLQTRFAFFARVLDAVSVKIRAAVQADELAAKQLDFGVVADNRFVFAEFHYFDIR